MKLTDEQIELYRTAFIGGYLKKWEFDAIISSEQTWKEEALENRKRWQNEVEVSEQVVQEREELIEQLNQAVKVLEWYADHTNYHPYRFMAGNGERARKFISSLSQETEQ